jgi:hypothetical protein
VTEAPARPNAEKDTRSVPRPLVAGLWTIVIGIMAQAVLAGQGLAGQAAVFSLHGGIGHGVLLVSGLVATFAWLTGAPRVVAILASVVALCLVGQTGLGYVGHRSGVAAATAVHVPLGVALLGLSVAAAVLAQVATSRR